MKKTVSYDPIPFHNKIFFCDIVGYSRLPAASQYECHAQLTRIIRTCLDRLNARLLEDVIALPTGDGLILNYFKAEPDIHLQTALLTLEILAKYNKKALQPIPLRIGLNTNVDSIVLDVNNEKNIVGKGINLAQRITDLSTHGRILMHRRVYEDLSNYEKYDGKITYLGDFTVKHNVVVPLFQYIDYSAAFLDNTPLKRTGDNSAAMTLSDIRKKRLKENILSIQLKAYDQDYFDDLHEYLEDFLDSQKLFQKTRIAVNWIANEMLDNVFKHGMLDHDDDVYLKLDRVKDGIFISTEQPDIPDFSIREIDNDANDHFLAMLHRRGIHISVLHSRGRMTLSCLLPNDFEIKELKMLDVDRGEDPESEIIVVPAEDEEFSATIRYQQMESGIYLIKVTAKIYEQEVGRLKAFITELIRAGKIDIVLDLSEVEYICSAGIAALIHCHRIIRREGGALIVVNPHEKIREIFAICKLDQILQISQSIEDALAFLKVFY